MNKLIIKLRFLIKVLWQKILVWPKISGLIAIIVGLSVIFGVGYFISLSQADLNSEKSVKEVAVASISFLSSDRGNLPLSGQVKSKSEVVVRAQVGGIVTSLSHRLGDSVGVGETIATLENTIQRADLSRAQSAVDMAKVQLGSGEQSLTEASHSLMNAVKGAYSAADDAVRNHADKFFTSPTSNTPLFSFGIQNGIVNYTFNVDYSLSSKANLDRRNVEIMLKEWNSHLKTLDENSDWQAEADSARKNLELTRTLLDDLSGILNSFNVYELTYKTIVDGNKSDLAGSRQTINGAISSLIATSDAYNTKKSTYGTTGSSVNLSALKQAEAGLLMAQAAYDKTIIRSPIGGTINSLSIEVGDNLSPMQEVAFVSNNRSLEILTYVSEDEKKDISIGSKIKVNNDLNGRVVSVAPALDPQTKKIEVKIVVEDDDSKLINGQAVSLLLDRGITNVAPEESVADLRNLMIPLSALKVLPDKMVVYSVSSTSQLVAHEVKEGPISGDKIMVTGIDPSLQIVVDARGLQEGDKVKLVGQK